MKIAITIWGNRISPVFDTAQMLLLVQMEEGRVLEMRREFIGNMAPEALADMLVQHGAEYLVCGAISEEPTRLLEKTGITVVSFIAGNVQKILHSFTRELPITDYVMPGCQRLGQGNLCCEKRQENRQGDTPPCKGFGLKSKC